MHFRYVSKTFAISKGLIGNFLAEYGMKSLLDSSTVYIKGNQFLLMLIFKLCAAHICFNCQIVFWYILFEFMVPMLSNIEFRFILEKHALMNIRYFWHAVPYVRFLMYVRLHCWRMPFGHVANQHIICIVYMLSIQGVFYERSCALKEFRGLFIFGINVSSLLMMAITWLM